MNYFPSLLCMLLGATYSGMSMAQTNLRTKTPRVYVAPSLTNLIASAEAERSIITRELDAEAKKGTGFNVCRADALDFQLKYDEWFLAHQHDYRNLHTQLTEVMTEARKKFESLQETSIFVLSVKGQTDSEVKVTLPQMIAYFQNLNERLSTCKPEDREALLNSQQKPNLNPLHLSHSQVIAAMDQMTTNMNASLVQQAGQFEIGFSEASLHYDLDFRIRTQIAGKPFSFNFSLLSKPLRAFNLTDEQKWKHLVRSELKIDGYSLDGKVRFFEMRKALMQKSCYLGNPMPTDGMASGLPFVKINQLNHVYVDKTVRTWQDWSAAGSSFRSAYVTESGDVIAVRKDGVLLRKPFSSGAWEQMTQALVKSVAVSPKGNIYAVAMNGKVYRQLSTSKTWNYFAGSGHVSSVVVNEEEKLICAYSNLHSSNGDSFGECGGVGETATIQDSGIPVAFNKNALYLLKNNSELWLFPLYTQNSGSAVSFKDQTYSEQTVGIRYSPDGSDSFYILTSAGRIYFNSANAWQLILDNEDEADPFVQFSVNSRKTVCGVRKSGRLQCSVERISP